MDHARGVVYNRGKPVETGSANITKLLLAWGQGDAEALAALTPLVYDHLHRLARHYMAGERPGHTLQATALVNEAYLRLIDSSKVRWQNRTHFFALAAQLMRRILVDFARSHANQKRGGGMHQTTLDESLVVSNKPTPDLVALDDALTALAAVDARKAQVVELKFFGGLDEKEIAQHLQISVDTVQRDWKTARAWLYSQLARR
ncbi:MAG: sigma-70 family RNA polymerase sigma factor [Acidobacteriales bacterium]|nr:sigma-70 family RNA polymerase sigma factor [Terriglobales bacterium]